jgi:hypothetical protein
MIMFGSFLPSLGRQATAIYPGRGAVIVKESLAGLFARLAMDFMELARLLKFHSSFLTLPANASH